MAARSTSAAWRRRLRKLRGEERFVQTDLAEHESTLGQVAGRGSALETLDDGDLQGAAQSLRTRARAGEAADELLPEAFALVRETADRLLGMRPFDVQVLAGIALHREELAEMQTGEGKTLAAVLPVFLHALYGRGVHVLTFNDYLARRDAAWMGPIYRHLGLRVAAIQEGMSGERRRDAYAADVTYATAKEAGFDFLRAQLARDPRELVQRPFHFAIVDEADSILIDEARVPLVIAGQRPTSHFDPYGMAAIVRGLERGRDSQTDENERNVFLTEAGLDRLERDLGCGSLHDPENLLVLTEINQALHASVLLRRDVDYIVRDGTVEVVDELTGRVVDDRRWPDGLQAALEAKEGVEIRPGGRVLGSIALQHFLGQYPRMAGMTATARSAAEELAEFYGLRVVVIPPNRPCIREDLPDLVFTHKPAKRDAMIAEIERVNAAGRPILVGTASVEESEELARALRHAGVSCSVLNAKNDEEEAGIVAQAGRVGAVTISTNMAGRGTDIRLGGADETDRDTVVRLGGLYVLGTNRHESRRIDDQLRGRAGRQGDPGASRFFVSLEDDLMVRFGIDGWLPARRRPDPQDEPIDSRALRWSIDHVQEVVEGQNFEIRKTLWQYSQLVEEQRRRLQQRRAGVLRGTVALELCARRAPRHHSTLRARFGDEPMREIERQITLAQLDRGWEGHLQRVAELREGIHLVRVGGLRPLDEFARRLVPEFDRLQEEIDRRIVESFEQVDPAADGIDRELERLRGPSSTWTYLVNDRGLGSLHEMLAGSFVVDPISALITGPLMGAMALWRRRRKKPGSTP